jgi:hypothetical protein
LVFWKEILDHARVAQYRAVVILSNDRKNDWYFGAFSSPETGRGPRDFMRPLPAPHPMLEHEAKSAGIADVMLLDSPYLAGVIDNGESPIPSFADVAIIREQPKPKSQNALRTDAISARAQVNTAADARLATEAGLRFLDSDTVAITEAALRRALFESRQHASPPVPDLLERCRTTATQQNPISDLLTADNLSSWNQTALVTFGRELHDLSLSDQLGWKEPTVDLCNLLKELPPRTAGCIYLGLLASMYMERSSNTPRLPPRSRTAALIYQCQTHDFAAPGLAILTKVMAASKKPLPVYLASAEAPPIPVTLTIEPELPGQDEVAGLTINGVDVLTTTQGDHDLTLGALFTPELIVKGSDLIGRACELFCVPKAQIVNISDFDRHFRFAPTTGFRKPGGVFNNTGGS